MKKEMYKQEASLDLAQDWANLFSAVISFKEEYPNDWHAKICKLLRDHPVKSVAERFKNSPDLVKDLTENHPELVARLNQLGEEMNNLPEPERMRQIVIEVFKLLWPGRTDRIDPEF